MDRKVGVVRYKQYVAGWLNSSVHDFLEFFPGGSGSTAYALITCLDSNQDPASSVNNNPDLGNAVGSAKRLKRGLLVPSRLLRDASIRDHFFFGYDEIWFFPSDKINEKPESASIVGPCRIDQARLDQLGHWMAENGCSLGLGDGNGLNIIVKATGLMRYLVAHTLSQRQSSFQPDKLWVQDEEHESSTARPATVRSADHDA